MNVINGKQIDTYELEDKSGFVALMNDKDKAEKIAGIVNNHDELVEALKVNQLMLTNFTCHEWVRDQMEKNHNLLKKIGVTV